MPGQQPQSPNKYSSIAQPVKEWADKYLRPEKPKPVPSALWKRFEDLFWGAIGFTVVYVFIRAYMQGRLWPIVNDYFAFAGYVLAALLIAETAPVTLPALGYVAWYQIAGSPHFWTDLAVLIVAVLVLSAYYYSATGTRHWGNSKVSAILFGLLSTCIVWVLISVADGFARTGPTKAAKPPAVTKGVGVALSGGGYRAALFHAGVLDALEQLRIAPSHLASVSGGSIIGAYYTLGGRPQQFRDAVVARQFGIKRRATSFADATKLMFCPGTIPGLRVRLFPGCDYGRSEVQASLLDAVLFDGVTLGDLPQSPQLVIAATDLDSAGIVGITRDRIVRIQQTPLELKNRYANSPPEGFGSTSANQPPTNWQSIPLSRAVAASGAFPVAFNPVVLDDGRNNVRLADGGVTDNSGLTALLGANKKLCWALRVVIVSDGSRALEEKAPASASSVLEDFSRTVDILSASSTLPPDLQSPNKLVLVSPNPLLRLLYDPSTLSAAVQQRWNNALQNSAAQNLLNSWRAEADLFQKSSKQATPQDLTGPASLIRALKMFAAAPTLQDEYSELEAFQLYQLGRYMVGLNAASIMASPATDASDTAASTPCVSAGNAAPKSRQGR
ncbi:hypothetical protein F183_A06460 [Bryobacterales bacterium F-183]|nr:hypothetical protein F183_A06460 [Bryobacterales bacterium F-183]